MLNPLVVAEKDQDGILHAGPGKTVQLYEYDGAAAPLFRGQLIGPFTEEAGGNGVYSIDLATSLKGVVVVDGTNLEGFIGSPWQGEDSVGSGSGIAETLSNLQIDTSLESFSFAISGYTNAPTVAIVPKSGWPVYIQSVTNTQITVGLLSFGDDVANAVFDLLIFSND
jgi:hypothetical protein